jgi:uncharacterized protein (DUF2384 family)
MLIPRVNVLAVAEDSTFVSAQGLDWRDAIRKAKTWKSLSEEQGSRQAKFIRFFVSYRDEALKLCFEEFTPEQLDKVSV